MKRQRRTGTRERMLITGANGLLGKDLCVRLSGRYEVLPTDLEECDVTSESECMRVIGGYRPDVVVHCAAYTAVDRAEREEEAAFALNAGGTRNVAFACRENRSLLVTFGTDYVFDGASERPYREDDAPGPLSAYGRSKLAAEEAVKDVGPHFLLIRTQWLFGPYGRNFASSILERARNEEHLTVVCDQRGSPTFTRDLADAVGYLLAAGARGIYHFSNEGETTFFDYALFLLSHAGLGKTQVSPLPTLDLPRDLYPAPRPLQAVLCKEKYRTTTGLTPRWWQDAVLDYLTIRAENDNAQKS